MSVDTRRPTVTDRSRSLARIADQLGVPLTEFYAPHLIRGSLDGQAEEASAVFALIQAYLAITDAETRYRSIQAVRAMAEADRAQRCSADTRSLGDIEAERVNR